MKESFILSIISILLLLTGCQPQPHHEKESGSLPDIYPDYIGVTIPADIAPLNFAMTDDAVDWMVVTVEGAQGDKLTSAGEDTDFDIDEWHQLLIKNKGAHLKVSVTTRKSGEWTRHKPFNVYVSSQPLGEWGVTYRRIPPSYSMYGLMGIWQRCLSNFDETPLLKTSQTPGLCVNCHTNNSTHAGQYVFHVRGAHGATIIQRQGQLDLLKAKNDTLGGSMVYPSWHPGGKYIAFSTNKTAQMFHMGNPKLIEVYDNSSDVFVYDVEKHTILRDSLVMTSTWSENCPAFSPDGKWLYFITALQRTYPQEFQQQRYNLCRVAFDEQTGKLGQQVDTLVRAEAMKKSVTWPRVSADGRYIMYSLINYGYFSVWHPEADLWLLDMKTGETRPMDEVNSQRSESLHQWSSNGHWFLFTSRRDDGLYTRLYFSSFGIDGKATKPFMLPQRHPKKYYRQLLDSYNTPDFTLQEIKANPQEMGRSIESDKRIETHTKEMK